jgi:hypothetical protein
MDSDKTNKLEWGLAMTISSGETHTQPARPRRYVLRVLGWCCLALAGYLAWSAHQVQPAGSPFSSSIPARPEGVPRHDHRDAQRMEELRRQFERAVREALSRNELNARRAEERLRHDLAQANPHFDQAAKNVDRIVEYLCSISTTKDLCLKMIRDRLRKTDTANAFLQDKMTEYVTRHCIEGMKQRQVALATYRDTLQRGLTELNTDLAQVALQADFAAAVDLGPLEQLIKDEQRWERFAGEIAKSSTFAGVGLAASLAAEACTRSVSATIGRVVRRFLAKSALITWLPVADGPLPIGDAVFAALEVGFMAWDANALYHARVTMRRELTDGLKKSIDQCRSHSRNEVLDRAVEGCALVDQYRQSVQHDLLSETADAVSSEAETSRG